MTTLIKENKKVFDFAYNFSKIVKKEGWISRYDIESDSLSLTVPKLPNDARIKYFGDEVAFYITKDNDIKGVFIEYFKSNFVKHHNDFKELLKDVEKKKQEEKNLIELNKNKMKKVISRFEKIIKDSLVESIEFKPTS